MKKVIRNSLVVAAMLGSITGYANLIPSNTWNEDIAKTILKIDDVKEGQRLLIKDVHGIILYREQIEISGIYNREFDLTSLPNGNYYFELDKAFEIKIIPFKVEASEVTFDKAATKSIYKPVVRVEDNVVFISKLSLDKAPLSIKLYYESDASISDGYELIKSEILDNSQNLKRVYRLSNKRTGNYKIVFKSEGRDFTEYFKI